MRRQSSWIRYGLARLRPLGRPVFWAPSIALLLLVLFAWEFFSRPELATFFASNSNETLSPEEQAIGADIDSLPMLLNDIKITSKPQAIDSAIQPTPSNSPNPAPTNRLFSAPTESITPPPAQTPSGQGVFGAFTSALTTRLGLPTTTQTDPTTPAPLPANRLQEAIDKLAPENRPVVAQTPIEGTIRLDNPINAAPRTNSFSALVEGVQPIPPGTAPLPSAPLPIAPLNAPVPTITPQPTQSSDFGVIQQPAPVVNQQPFTVPRSIPGRAIGGGNFNTFSNP